MMLTGVDAVLSGGIYSEEPSAANNYAVPYLNTVLGFIGITEVE